MAKNVFKQNWPSFCQSNAIYMTGMYQGIVKWFDLSWQLNYIFVVMEQYGRLVIVRFLQQQTL